MSLLENYFWSFEYLTTKHVFTGSHSVTDAADISLSRKAKFLSDPTLDSDIRPKGYRESSQPSLWNSIRASTSTEDLCSSKWRQPSFSWTQPRKRNGVSQTRRLVFRDTFNQRGRRLSANCMFTFVTVDRKWFSTLMPMFPRNISLSDAVALPLQVAANYHILSAAELQSCAPLIWLHAMRFHSFVLFLQSHVQLPSLLENKQSVQALEMCAGYLYSGVRSGPSVLPLAALRHHTTKLICYFCAGRPIWWPEGLEKHFVVPWIRW